MYSKVRCDEYCAKKNPELNRQSRQRCSLVTLAADPRSDDALELQPRRTQALIGLGLIVQAT